MRNCKKCGKIGYIEEFKTKFKCLDCHKTYEQEKHKRRYIPRSQIIDPIKLEQIKQKNIQAKNYAKNKKKNPNELEKFRKYQREYWRERRKKEPTLKLVHNHRTRVRLALNGIYKLESSLVLLGCKTEELKKHIESLFVDGMNWLNYGEWEIDHIRPCSSFDLSDPKQQKECFHYTNLQPLWKQDNRLKSDKTDSI
jgi:hypothetical protein